MFLGILCTKMCGGYVRLSYTLLILAALTWSCVGTKEINSPSLDFSRHSIIHPVVHHGRTKREISTTRDTNGAHHSEVQVTVPVDGEPWMLELRLNEDLVAGGHTLQYQEGGNTVKHILKKEELDLCHYSGRVRGKPQSWVAVSTCHGVRGVIFDGQRMRYIEPTQDADIQSSHFLYDHKDLTKKRYLIPNQQYKPGIDHGTRNNTIYDPVLSSSSRGHTEIKRKLSNRDKRETNSQIREPYNANKSSRYVELVLVADYKQFVAKGRDLRAVQLELIQIANIMNSLYAPLNIFIALVGVVVWSEGDKIRVVKNGDETLIEFLSYRKNKLIAEIPHDNAHLLTHLKFYDGVVGKALPFSMCKLNSSGGVEVVHTDVVGLQAATVAHEIGHNFGIQFHDEECQIQDCPDKKCIMSMSSTSLIPENWSRCSLEALNKALEKGQDYCLHNKPERLAFSQTCGNGFVEPGEQCDCGVTIGGRVNPCHACCNPKTCMLHSNATCGAGACCDFSTCRLKSASVMCRSADSECDLPEYCTGHSEYCPTDVYKMDATPCSDGNEQAYCMQGSCRSHTNQCRLLWGSTGRIHQECYTKNTAGNREGHCGYDSSGYKACAESDAMCGLLHCHTDHNYLHHAMGYGIDSGAETRASSYVRNRVRFDCFTAKVNHNNVDLGLVPDGSKCGHEKMCLNQRCVSVKMIQERATARESSVCPSNCSGHGVCNSEGHCHCDEGFAPPLCSLRGPGGSVDSGPATKLNDGYITPRTDNPSNRHVTSRYEHSKNHHITHRPDNHSNNRNVTPRPYNPNNRTVTRRPDNTYNRYVTPRPDNNNNRYVTPRPDNNNNHYVTPRRDNTNNHYVTPRPDNTNNRYVTPRPDNTNNHFVTPRPDNTNNRYVTPRPDNNTNNRYVPPRPDKTNNRYVHPRPDNTNNRYVTPRPDNTNNRNVTPRPDNNNNRYVTPRRDNTNNHYVTPRPDNTNNRYVTPRPDNTNNRFVTPRPDNTNNRYVTPRPDNTNNRYVPPRPDNTNNRYVPPRPDNTNNRYGSSRPDNTNNRYVTPRPDNTNNRYVTPRPDNNNNRYVTPRRDNTNNRYVTPRPDNTNNRFVTPRPDNTNNRYVTPRPDNTNNRYVPPRPDNTNNRYVPPRPDNTNNRYVTPRPDNTNNRYVPPRTDNTNNRYVPPRTDNTNNRYVTPRRDNTNNRYVTLSPIKSSTGYVITTSVKPSSIPTSDSNENRYFKILMYVIFLGIIPLIILLLFLIYYLRHNKVWRESKIFFASHIAANKLRKKSILDDICLENTDKDNEERPTSVEMAQNKPKKITKDGIKLLSDVQFGVLESEHTQDDVLATINKIKLKPVNRISKIYENCSQTALDNAKLDLRNPNPKLTSKPVKPKLNVNKDSNLMISDANLEFANPMLKENEDIKKTANVKSKTVNSMLRDNKDNIKVENISKNDIGDMDSDTKMKSKPMYKTDLSKIRIGINDIKLKTVKPMSNINKNDIEVIPNIKLKPALITKNDNTQVEFDNVKLKPVKPLVGNKPKPKMKLKSEWLNSKHVK